MNKTKGILTNVVIILGAFALLFFTQSCGTVAGIGKDIQDVSDWSKEKISKKLNDEGGEQNDFAYENTEVKIKDIE